MTVLSVVPEAGDHLNRKARRFQMKPAYLDWNVFESLRRGELPELAEAVIGWKAREAGVTPFSAHHLAEMRRGLRAGDSVLTERLGFISELSGNYYLASVGPAGPPVLRRQHPAEVWATINEVPWVADEMEKLANLLGHGDRANFWDALKLAPVELNNVSPPDAFTKLEAIVNPKIEQTWPGPPPIPALRGLIDLAIRLHPDGARFGWGERFAAFFTLLNWVGFWPDDLRAKGGLSPFYDSQHAALAAWTDCFVSGDRRLLHKCACAYEYFTVKTEVLSPSAAIGWFAAPS